MPTLWADASPDGRHALVTTIFDRTEAIGARAATRRYTFGYRRAEDLAGLFVLVMIAASALLAAWECRRAKSPSSAVGVRQRQSPA